MDSGEIVKSLDKIMKLALTTRNMVWVPLLALALMACSCATIAENTHAYLGSPQLPPANPANVQIYATEPKGSKDRLGEVILSIEGNPSRQKIEDKLKVAASKLGADGVYIASDRTHIYPVVYSDCCGAMSTEEWDRVVVGVAFKNK